MKECYSAKAIESMFFYAQVHTLIEFALVLAGLVVFVYVFERIKRLER